MLSKLVRASSDLSAPCWPCGSQGISASVPLSHHAISRISVVYLSELEVLDDRFDLLGLAVLQVEYGALSALARRPPLGRSPSSGRGGRHPRDLGLNSIDFQQDVQPNFQQSTGHFVRLNTLLNIMLNSLLKFN